MQLGLIHRPRPSLVRLRTMLDNLAVPRAVDWISRITLTGDALGNDVHSNCVPCGALRGVQIMRAVSAGDSRAPTAEQALLLYRAWSGWDGSDATDSGTESDVAAALWSAHGVRWGAQWEDVPTVEPITPAPGQLQAAIAHLGPVQLDLAMPLAWQDAPSTWIVVDGDRGAPGSWGAHRVCAAGYDPQCLYVVTWGRRVGITWPAVSRYALGAEAVLSQSWMDADGRSPTGLDFAALTRALHEVAS